MELEKLLNNAEALLQKFADREDWSEANIKKGNRDGIKIYSRFNKDSEELNRYYEMAEMGVEVSVRKGNYGKAAYWRAYLTGWMQAETCAKLDELDTLEKTK